MQAKNLKLNYMYMYVKGRWRLYMPILKVFSYDPNTRTAEI